MTAEDVRDVVFPAVDPLMVEVLEPAADVETLPLVIGGFFEVLVRLPCAVPAAGDPFEAFLLEAERLFEAASLVDFEPDFPLREREAFFPLVVPLFAECFEIFPRDGPAERVGPWERPLSRGRLKFGTASVGLRAPGLCSFFMICRHWSCNSLMSWFSCCWSC